MRVTRLVRIAVLVVLLGLVGVSAAPAGAKNDHVVRDDYEFAVEDVEVCGVVVDIAGSGTFRATIKEWVIGPVDPPVDPADPPANDFWLGTINDHGSETHTDVATGETVVLSWRVNIREASLEYLGDGNYAYTFAVNGAPLRIDGRPVDRGHIVITDVIHLGDLSTVEDDEFVGTSASAMGGRTPRTTTTRPSARPTWRPGANPDRSSPRLNSVSTDALRTTKRGARRVVRPWPNDSQLGHNATRR
jgi:hypothetical protein